MIIHDFLSLNIEVISKDGPHASTASKQPRTSLSKFGGDSIYFIAAGLTAPPSPPQPAQPAHRLYPYDSLTKNDFGSLARQKLIPIRRGCALQKHGALARALFSLNAASCQRCMGCALDSIGALSLTGVG